MNAISIKIKQSKLSNPEKFTESLDKYLRRKLKGIPDTTKYTFMFGHIGNDFPEGFIHLIIY